MATLTSQQITDLINQGQVVFGECGGTQKRIDELSEIPGDLTTCGFTERILGDYLVVGSPTNGQVPSYNSTTQKLQWATVASGGGTWGSITGTLSNQTDLQSALNLKAPLASPALTGTPTTPTAAGGTNTTQIASTAFVRGEITSLIDSAPSALDTLNELAAALGNDANFATTVTNALAAKANLNSPTLITPTIAKLANLTTDGFVKTSGGDGTLVVDTNTYLTSAGAVTSITGTTNQISASASIGAITLSMPTDVHIAGSFFLGGTGSIQFGDTGIGGAIRGFLNTTADGIFRFGDSAGGGSPQIILGSAGASTGVRIKRSSTILAVRNGDDTADASITASNLNLTGTQTITNNSGTIFAAGRQGATNPALSVVSSGGTDATGISVTSAVAGSGATIGVTSSGSNESLLLTPKGAAGLVKITNLGSATLGSMVTASQGGEIRVAPTLATSTGAASFWGYQNINNATWAAGVATITTALTHNYSVGALASINGVTPSGFNGIYRIASTPSATTFTYALPSDPGTYSAGADYVVLEPEAQFQPSSPNVPALMIVAHPTSVTLGIDSGLPVLGVTGNGSNYHNTSWFVAADGHTMELWAGGNQKWFANGFVDTRTSDNEIGWTSGVGVSPGISANRDLIILRDAANTLAQRNSTNAQTFRVYNTYTDASNYERLSLLYSANIATIVSQGAGTGTPRMLLLQGGGIGGLGIGGSTGTNWHLNTSGHFLATTDNTFDIGAVGATRPRNVYVAGNVVGAGQVIGANSAGVSGAGNFVMASSRGFIIPSSDGVWQFTNNATTDFSRLQFGGTTSSFPSIKRNGAGIDFRLADDSGYAVIAAKELDLDKTITAGGTTGAQTINKALGSVNFAAAATSLVVTNSLVTTTSLIFCTVQTNDTTLTSAQAVAGSGSFTIYGNAAATAETKVAFVVYN